MNHREICNFSHRAAKLCTRSLLYCLLLTGFLQSGLAATYYVDFLDGDDNNSGTSQAAAWKRCPGDPEATAVPANVNLAPGDVIRFKGGVRYNGRIEVNWSGSDGNFITYDGNSSGDWGDGRAVIDNENGPSTAAFAASRPQSDLQFLNFEVTRIGGYPADDPILSQTCSEGAITSPRGGIGFNFSKGGNNLVFKNMVLHEIGQWRNQQPFSGVNAITGSGILLDNTINVFVENCEFTRMRIGVNAGAAPLGGGILKDLSIINCDFHNYLVWPVDIATATDDVIIENVLIKNSRFHDYHEYDKGNWMGCGEKPHTDGIFLRSAGKASIWRNIVIDSNDFYSDDSGQSVGGTAAIYLSQGPSATIINNVFRGVVQTRTIGIGHSNPAGMPKQVVKIYNNTFIDTQKAILMAGETDPSKREVYIQNNVFVNVTSRANSVMLMYGELPPTVLENNFYYSPLFSSSEKYVALANGKWLKFDDLRRSGFEQNGQFRNPRLARIDAPISTAASMNIATPITESPLLSLGASLPEVRWDKSGKIRTAPGLGIGAYSVITPPSQVGPSAPKGLRVE